MTFTTGTYVWDLFLAVLLDGRVQIAFLIAWSIQWAWRLPRPRKGAGHKAIFITSCDSEIGQRLAKRFDDMKAYVFAGVLDPQSPAAKNLQSSCSSRLRLVPLDVSKEDMVDNAVAYVKENMPVGQKSSGLYGLINNAGVLSYSNFDLMTTEHCRQIIDMNLLGTIRVTKKFLPLIKATSGRIINVSSVLGRLTSPNTSIYTATKHALDGFFSTLRFDVTSAGVQIATVEPGYFSTTSDVIEWTKTHLEEMWKGLSSEEQKDKFHLYEDAKQMFTRSPTTSQKQELKYKYIVEDVEDAMFAEEPYYRYVSAPFSQRCLLSLLRMLPDEWYQSIMFRSKKNRYDD